jgi:two-component system response regulator
MERRYPRIIVLDLKMLKVDGMEVLKRLKENEQTKEIPVVILSSSTLESDMETCYALGVNSFVSKPVKVEEYFDTLKHISSYWLKHNKTLIR